MSSGNYHMSGVLRGKHSPCPHTTHHPGELQGIIARVQYSDSASLHLQTVDQLRVKLRIEWQRVEYNMADTPEMEPGGEGGVECDRGNGSSEHDHATVCTPPVKVCSFCVEEELPLSMEELGPCSGDV